MTFIYLAGSLGLFLYGMNIMGKGLQKMSGGKLQQILGVLTQNRFTGVLTGFLVTVLVQSSSVTTVITVGFVHGGLLSLTQAIGVIMGANIGTTITGWLVAILGFRFHIVDFAFVTMTIGIILTVVPKIKRPAIGEILIGFSILFIGLDFMKNSVPDIGSNPDALSFVRSFSDLGVLSPLLFILFGTALTVIVQSSSAAMAITLTLAFSGWIDFHNSAAIILGENIGTTITAYLASLGQNVHSRRAARTHTLFNLFGVIWMLAVFRPFISLIDWIIPGDLNDHESITSQLALFHTLFNIINTSICIWFIPQLAKLVERLVKPRSSDLPDVYHLEYIDTGLPDSVELNLQKAVQEIRAYASSIGTIYDMTIAEILGEHNDPINTYDSLKPVLEKTRTMHHEISGLLVACTQHTMDEEESLRTAGYLQTVQELDNMSESIEKMVRNLQKYHANKVPLGKKDTEQLHVYFSLIREFITFIVSKLPDLLSEHDLEIANEYESKIDKLRNQLRKRSRKRMEEGEGAIKHELFFMDILRHAEHLGDFSLNIAEALSMTKD